MASVDAWAAKQADVPGRSEAIRRLVELGLTVRTKRKQAAAKRADRAKELAAKAIDSLTVEAPDDEKANRKRRLLKGLRNSGMCA